MIDELEPDEVPEPVDAPTTWLDTIASMVGKLGADDDLSSIAWPEGVEVESRTPTDANAERISGF
jgi:hypothetical protein